MNESAPPTGLDFLALGHVTADVGPDGAPVPGGGVYYASAIATAMGLRTGLVTRAAQAALPDACLPGVSCHVVDADVTTTFENRYDVHGNRTQLLLDLAPALEPGDVPPAWRRVGVLHVAPVVHEVGPDVVRSIDAEFVGLTPQGWLRMIEIGRPATPAPWGVPDGLVERADAVVLSEEDLGRDERRLPWLTERVPIVVLTRGGRGAHVFTQGTSMFQPAVAAHGHNPTGAGDSFAAALFVRLWEKSDLPSALRFAASAAAYAVDEPGPARLPDRRTVQRRGDTA